MYDYGVSNLAQGFLRGQQQAKDEQELERQRLRQERADQRVEQEYAYTQSRRAVEDPLRDRTMAAQADGAELGLTQKRNEINEWTAAAPTRAAQRDLDARTLKYEADNFDANKAAERQLRDLQVRTARVNLGNASLRGRTEQLQLEGLEREASTQRYVAEVATPLMAAIQSGDEETVRRVAPELNPRMLQRNEERGTYNIVVDMPTGQRDESGRMITRPTPIVGENPESIAAKLAMVQNPQVGATMMVNYYADRAARAGERAKAAAEKVEEQRDTMLEALQKSPQFQMASAEEKMAEIVKIDVQIADRLAELVDEDGDGVPDADQVDRPGLSYHVDRAGGARPAGNAEAPKSGDVIDGYRFKGGDPGNPSSWEKI